MDHNGREGREELGRVEGEAIVIRIYYVCGGVTTISKG